MEPTVVSVEMTTDETGTQYELHFNGVVFTRSFMPAGKALHGAVSLRRWLCAQWSGVDPEMLAAIEGD